MTLSVEKSSPKMWTTYVFNLKKLPEVKKSRIGPKFAQSGHSGSDGHRLLSISLPKKLNKYDLRTGLLKGNLFLKKKKESFVPGAPTRRSSTASPLTSAAWIVQPTLA
jgi:hypothetical protein